MTDPIRSHHEAQAEKKTAICSHCGHRCRGRYDKRNLRVRDLSVAGWRIYLEFERWRVNCPRCGGVHVEHLDWLAKNPRYTQRFAMQVGKLCRDMPNKTVAEMERLHHSTVKDLDKLYMQKQVDLAGLPHPGPSVLMRSPSAKGITTGSLSATWIGGAPSGSVVRAAKRLISTCFSRPWARKRALTSNWLPWTCGSLSGTQL